MGRSKASDNKNSSKSDKAPKVSLRDVGAQLHAEKKARERLIVENNVVSE